MDLYSDLNTYSPKDDALVKELASINQSIIAILSTRKGERLFNLHFGVDLDSYLFDLMDELSIVQALDSVILAIETYEPRVTINYTETTINPDIDKHSLELNLVFSVVGLADQKFSLNKVFTR